jgi:hypothetical protein
MNAAIQIRHARPLILCVAILSGVPAFGQIDLAGEWSVRIHEDLLQRRDPPGPDIGDYTGLPINDAARLRAESWDASILTVREHQTVPFSVAYQFRGGSSMRISKVVDDATQKVIALKILRGAPSGAVRTIWMDGRPHPPDYAAHTFQGFSTGKWEGDTLTIETTHIKAGIIQRNGVPHSDRATLVEHFLRHGTNLTVVGIVQDPAYLEEPFIRTSNYVLDPHQELGPVPTEVVDEIAGRPDGYVPHHLPGMNDQLKDFSKQTGVPWEAARGGRVTTYPEYQFTLRELMNTHH